MKPTMIFLINSIDLIRGGLTKASLKQASFFAEMGYETLMLTFNFNPNYPVIRKKLLDLGKIHEDVTILNFFEDLGGDNTAPCDILYKKASFSNLTEGLPYDKRKGYNAYRVYDNGLYKKYISLDENDSLDFIDYFNENRYRTKREEFDPWGNLKKVSFMDLQLNKVRQAVYYNHNKQAYCSQWFNPSTGKLQRTIIFGDDNKIQSYVNDELSFKVDWVKRIVDRCDNDRNIVVSDTRSTDEVLINTDHPKIAKVWRLHSSHLDRPFTKDADITKKVKKGIEHLKAFDVALFLTEEQRNDIEERFNYQTEYCVVPHYHETDLGFFTKTLNNIIGKKNVCEENLAVVVTRLSTLKRVDHIIRAFRIVVDELPSMKLEIWGTGDEYDNLQKLITELNLKDNVALKGYTQSPDTVYQRGLFSILTSKQEGFSLSVLESMYNCTPVVSYNIKYGPTDLILHDRAGYIVDDGNIEKLAEKMIYMFNNPKQTIKMGNAANKHINQFYNRNIYKQKWLDAIEVACRKFD